VTTAPATAAHARLLLAAVVLAALLLPASPAGAHPLGLPAFVRLAATDTHTVTVLWNAAPDDVAVLGRSLGIDVPADGALTREQDALLSRSVELRAAIERGIVIRQAGERCPTRAVEIDSIVTSGATLHVRCPERVEVVDLEVPLLSDLDDRYLTLVVAGGPEGLDRWMLSGTQPEHGFLLDPASADAVLAAAPPAVDADGRRGGSVVFGGSLPFEQHLIRLVEDTSTLLALLLGLLVAFGIGAAHGLAPGHGKAVAAAYLVGDRARPRDAVLLGASVALMHSGSVLVLGFVLFRAADRVSVTALSTWLQVIAGVIVAALGVWLLRRRWQERATSAPLESSSAPAPVLVGAGVGGDGQHHALDHTHDHTHDHAHGHTHAHGDGRPHTHVPEGGVSPLSWRGLVALGAAGGLLPSPSALLVLFTSLAIGRVGYGLGLIAAFSVGLAMTVTVFGLAALWGRDLLGESLKVGRAAVLRRYAPTAAACGVILLGVVVVLRSASTLL
jgi:ABC-type nickel/cobalt efflux system permease component RcnA